MKTDLRGANHVIRTEFLSNGSAGSSTIRTNLKTLTASKHVYLPLINVLRIRVEADKNTSTVALRTVRGDKREPSSRGYNWATLFLGETKTGTWPSKLGESQMRQ
jgi:hypothetical protein